MGFLSFFKRGASNTAARTLTHKNNPIRTAVRSSFGAGEVDRLTASFTGSTLSANAAIERSLPMVRARSRQLCMDNDYASKFLKMVKANVIGTNGIQLQCEFKNNRGEDDNADNDYIEGQFKAWAKPKQCSANNRQSWIDIQRQVVETVARDGECLVQLMRDPKHRFGLMLKVLECDHLEINHNAILSNGNHIKMGIELDGNEKAVAYYLKTTHPGEAGAHVPGKAKRIVARDMLHLYIADRPSQLRGMPWMASAIRRLNMLGGYEEAELVAARVGASKMGFYTSADGDGYTADDAAPDGQDGDDGALVQEATPGTFEQLPDGVSFQTFDPQHPTSAFADFTKAVLRGAASGMNVAYNTLANDLEGVNFSSIRSGVLEEREQWRGIQRWLTEQLHEPVYDAWLDEFLFKSSTPLPYAKINSKYANVRWQPRGWDWIDPLKDIKANAEGIAQGTTTRSEVAAAKGKDLRDIFAQLAREKKLAEEYGLNLKQEIDPNQTTADEAPQNAKN